MLETVAIGLVAGVVAGMLGVGGGAIIVPGLVVFLGLSQVAAEATSLLAIVPTAMAGAWSQDRYGNVHRRDALLVGALSAAGALAGVASANALPERTLRVAFAVLLVAVAASLARKALGRPAEDEGGAG